MSEAWEILGSYPTSIYTLLIVVLSIFWLFSILGAIDIDLFQVDADVDMELDIDGEIPGFLGLLHTLGLTGVPFTIVLTLIVFIAWMITTLTAVYLLPLVPGTLLNIIVGTATLVASFVVAVPVTSKIIAPLRKLSAENSAKTNKDFLGSICIVKSSTVDDKYGQGEIQDNGAGLLVTIVADVPNTIKKGDVVRPISYDRNKNTYHVLTNAEFERNIDHLNTEQK